MSPFCINMSFDISIGLLLFLQPFLAQGRGVSLETMYIPITKLDSACCIYICIFVHTYNRVCVCVGNNNEEKEPINLRMKRHEKDLREGSWEGGKGGEKAGSDIILFQLQTY